MDKPTEEMVCPKCNGRGGLRGINWDEVITIRCPTCEGTGKTAKAHRDKEVCPECIDGKVFNQQHPSILDQCPTCKGTAHRDSPGISPHALPSQAYDEYFTPPDSPDREKIQKLKGMIKSITELSSDRDKWPEMFDIIDQISALSPDIEQAMKKERLDNFWLMTELRNKLAEKDVELEQAKREERERIRVWGSERCLDHHTSMNNVLHRTCNECWQALKEKE